MRTTFKKAHEMTRKMVNKYGVDYRAQFAINLSFLLNEKEEKEMFTTDKLAQMIGEEIKKGEVKLEVKRWTKYDKDRIYINIRLVNANKNMKYYIDLIENKVVSQNQQHNQRYMQEIKETIYNLIANNQEDIKKLVIEDAEPKKNKSEKTKKETADSIERNLTDMAYRMSDEDFEDITGRSRDHFLNVR